MTVVSIGPRRLLTSLGVIFAVVTFSTSAATATAPSLLKSLKPAPTPSGWRLLIPKARGSRLWYPPSMKPVSGDPYSVTAALPAGRNNADLLYLNAGPKTGPERLSDWPSFRIAHIRVDQNRWVHEDAQAFDVPFHGGHGSCVLDDYVTIVHSNHYREIACFVQGRTTASVIVAATLAKDWSRYRRQLERALEAWQVR